VDLVSLSKIQTKLILIKKQTKSSILLIISTINKVVTLVFFVASIPNISVLLSSYFSHPINKIKISGNYKFLVFKNIIKLKTQGQL
jgi:hypothetical protein